MYTVSNVLISNLKYQLFNLNEIFPVSVSNFRRFRDQIPKFEHFGPKSINFCLYAISKVLIWNLRFAFCGS